MAKVSKNAKTANKGLLQQEKWVKVVSFHKKENGGLKVKSKMYREKDITE